MLELLPLSNQALNDLVVLDSERTLEVSLEAGRQGRIYEEEND